MAIVWPCLLDVDAYAAAGVSVAVPRPACPGCDGPMQRWGGYWRFVRVGVAVRVWFARMRCRACVTSHALVPAFCLLGRLDGIEVIGPALAAGVSGDSDATVARAIDVPESSVRGWRRRHRDRAAMLVAGVTAVVVSLGGVAPRLSPDAQRASVEAVGALWCAARGVLGARAGPAWRNWAVVCGGAALSPNTIPPWTGLGGRGLLAPVPGTLPGSEEMGP